MFWTKYCTFSLLHAVWITDIWSLISSKFYRPSVGTLDDWFFSLVTRESKNKLLCIKWPGNTFSLDLARVLKRLGRGGGGEGNLLRSHKPECITLKRGQSVVNLWRPQDRYRLISLCSGKQLSRLSARSRHNWSRGLHCTADTNDRFWTAAVNEWKNWNKFLVELSSQLHYLTYFPSLLF